MQKESPGKYPNVNPKLIPLINAMNDDTQLLHDLYQGLCKIQTPSSQWLIGITELSKSTIILLPHLLAKLGCGKKKIGYYSNHSYKNFHNSPPSGMKVLFNHNVTSYTTT
jgi:hypothetical protein